MNCPMPTREKSVHAAWNAWFDRQADGDVFLSVVFEAGWDAAIEVLPGELERTKQRKRLQALEKAIFKRNWRAVERAATALRKAHNRPEDWI